MAGLLDLAPATETVNGVDVLGISTKGLIYLLGRFPELAAMFNGEQPSLDRLRQVGGECVAAIIAVGCGYVGDENAEAMAGNIAIGGQHDLLKAIWRLTLPNGVGPLVETLQALGGGFPVQGASRIRLRSMKSRPPSNGSATPEATAPAMSSI